MKDILFEVSGIVGVYFFQSMVALLGIYAYTGTKLSFNKYVIGALIATTGGTVVRLLPLHFGVHTILSMIILIFIGIFLMKLPVYAVIRATLFSTLTLLLVEVINVAICRLILPAELFAELVAKEQEITVITGIVTNILYLGVILLIYRITVHRRNMRRKKVRGEGM